ncbi:Rab guanine nucleotide exchange factor sec2 [Fulvia fulva]|uniref:Rab guanine nucleotide exchange factor sec2 n=1 Tax=Passalora fulva TaxID=5499 RepID=A0A9Q8PM58_PASFU|nr:Rab guanine nucleotide exchange factor sec2 [Fulvia fulva]KAK4608985.1 Rab guanine nucleotide exchange factor sec2 [Fulvia fulva]UJO24919.1 Rab guanine nucleotide exchange factor sec2 [Fulvia fulva]WPV22563.1 Rab guanine nucleotide exchange factor sec2 [Fulvia fulva]WPV37783.1 Rab guanine nucleotide exchange factor sec2 [Fulvia fulva]
MAAVASPQNQPISAMRDEVTDTRTPSPVHRTDSSDSETREPVYQPDLSAEVAMLSTKLVNAINYQTNLDDSLQQSRHELEQQRQRCTTLEEEKRRVDQLITSGALVRKSETDKIILKLRQELNSEKTAREIAERDKKKVEGELENLTSALFEEANNMVAAARKDTEAVEKRNAQLRSQLQDTEMLLASQQEQLQDLKATMEKQHEATMCRVPSMPSTPITTQGATFDALQISPTDSSLPDIPPEHPLHFVQLISPVLRSDTSAYTDFQDLLLLARRLGAHSRTNSSTATQTASGGSIAANQLASASSPNLPGAFSFSTNSSPSSFATSGTLPPLKDSKFYKRVLTEDIEPCLRLDLAPGLSFLSRRTVLGALLQGTLAVEPYPQNKHYFACTLCGESRRNEPYVRKYRFRTSEDDGVSKPLCDYCVARLRSTCDFVGFLRMIRDGHWRTDSGEDQKSAWEESVRLRERMFWTRLGGGVVPAQQLRTVPPTLSSAVDARHSLESIPEAQVKSVETSDGTSDVFQGHPDRPKSAVGSAIVDMSSTAAASAAPELRPQPSSQRSNDDKDDTTKEASTEDSERSPSEDIMKSLRDSTQALSVEKETTPRTSLQVPAPEPEASPRTSLTVEQSHQPERRGSSVLARVRAMESQGKSLPGAFE